MRNGAEIEGYFDLASEIIEPQDSSEKNEDERDTGFMSRN